MYNLTPRMAQRLRQDLEKFHDMFTAKRCDAWQLEELIVAAINSDTQVHHSVVWQEAGHDDKADIRVRTNGDMHELQIKSGTVTKDKLVLSGHRLGRFAGNFEDISTYLNSVEADILSVPYQQVNNEKGRRHIYDICYIDIGYMSAVASDWTAHGKQYVQTNQHGVELSLRPSMSWQIWWTIPMALVEKTQRIEIG